MRHRSSGNNFQEESAANLMERDFVRVPLRFLIHYREYPASQFQPMSQDFKSRNISGSGLLVETNRAMDEGLLLEMTLRIPGWHRYRGDAMKPDWKSVPETLTLLGMVVRCAEILPEEKYEIGIEFTHIDAGDRAALLKYLQDTGSDPIRA